MAALVSTLSLGESKAPAGIRAVLVGAFSPITGKMRLGLVVGANEEKVQELENEPSSSLRLLFGLVKPVRSVFEVH